MNSDEIQRYMKKGIGIPLIIWGSLNVISGVLLFFNLANLVNGIVIQAVFWGLINGIIGITSYLNKKDQNPEKIKKILIINAILDVGYVIGAVILILLSKRSFWIGTGFGVMFQGLFLLVTDIIHPIKITRISHL